ncbi:hypothetical protein PSTG_14199 [Puccinia striiformis f. sp. tritici PST-78]|uniref:CxC1-like cysteine cluster associated with KDZ transposases domain-containing protein n=1 Tax=Puccinia striiformis f. sp. tritici PST-78 TaxID=1165861 RepID=A0A0L0UZH1_9BASI|nr:hypothetical protein PSTG_14199 [Puccinia striiformis f. sp. tritici PST-78]
MGGFEGEGGKKQRQSKKPQTAQGVAFQEEIERGSQEFISTLQPPQPAPQDASRLTNHSQQQDFNNDTNHEHNYEGETVPINRQVQQLQDYLESEDHMLKKLLEEKHWEEVYDGMFSRFYECSAKTSDWGDPVEWNRDFKLPCRCTHTRTRPVVLIDIFTRKQEEVIFCDCQRDQMRLVQMGYIGGAPKFPQANQTGAVHLLLARGKHIEQEKTKSSKILRQIELEFGHNLENLKGQWDRQRAIQLSVMETATKKEMLDQIEELVELEDKLREANRELHELRQTRRRRRTTVQSHRLEQIPETLTFIEAEIGSLVAELGSENFRNLPGASNAQSKALIKLKVSKSKLYEAKVGVVEMQRKWDTGGSGTRVQARYKKQMNEKVRLLKNKWLAYDHRAKNYNSEFTLQTALETPTLEEVKSFGMEDAFWNMGPVSHPNEPWAIDLNIQKGISAYLTLIHCQDELNRISREARQAVKWAIQRDKKMEEIYTALNSENQETDVLTETQTRMANISSNHHFQKSNSAKRHCRLWMSWNQKCRELLSWSNKYVINQTDENSNLLEHWDSLIVKSQDMWEKLVKGQSVIMEFGDQADHEEEEILDQEVLEHQGGEPEMFGTIN